MSAGECQTTNKLDHTDEENEKPIIALDEGMYGKTCIMNVTLFATVLPSRYYVCFFPDKNNNLRTDYLPPSFLFSYPTHAQVILPC